MRYRIELPREGGAEAVRQFIADWVESPALRTLVEAEGGSWPSGDLRHRFEALHAFSSRWDFRMGTERLNMLAQPNNVNADLIQEAGEALGLTIAHWPTDSQYDHALVLGGTALASVYRVQRLFEFQQMGVAVGSPVALTALRDISQSELDLVRSRPDISFITGDATTEFAVITQTVSHFGKAQPEIVEHPNENPHLASATAKVGNTLVVAAPSSDPARRANTRDNYKAYAQHIGHSDTVLVITSSIYLPYQFLVAIQSLGHEHPRTIEAVGFPPEWMQGVLTGHQNVLQELRSAFFGACETLRMLEATA